MEEEVGTRKALSSNRLQDACGCIDARGCVLVLPRRRFRRRTILCAAIPSRKKAALVATAKGSGTFRLKSPRLLR